MKSAGKKFGRFFDRGKANRDKRLESLAKEETYSWE
jgi:hypothetical protein